MASLLEKVRILVAADLNRLVDRALASSEPAVFRQHIREMQELEEQLGENLAAARGEISGLRRKADAQQSVVIKQDLEVDELLRAGLHEDALAAQERLNQSQVVAARLTEQLSQLERRYSEMAEAEAQLRARVTALKDQAPAVEGLVGLARAKELTVAAAHSLEDLAGSGDPDVARVVEAIRMRLAEAEAQIQELEKRELARGETPEVLKRRELEGQLEARKARLGLAEPAAPPVDKGDQGA